MNTYTIEVTYTDNYVKDIWHDSKGVLHYNAEDLRVYT